MIKILAPKLDWTIIQCIANYQPEKRHNILQSLKDYKENLISSISKNFEIRAILTADSRQAAVQIFQSNIKWHSDNNSRSGATVDTENGMPSFWKKIQVNCEELWKAKANTHLKVSVEKMAQPSEWALESSIDNQTNQAEWPEWQRTFCQQMWFLSLTFVQSHIGTNLTIVPSTAIGLVASAAWCDEMGKNGSGC